MTCNNVVGYMISVIDMVFVAVAAFEILFTVMIFSMRNALHSAVALALLFLANSAVFLLLSQPLLAVLQLFVMIGGISTYLFISVAYVKYSLMGRKRAIAAGILAALLFAVLSYPLLSSKVDFGTAQSNVLDISSLPQYMAGSLQFFYVIAAVLFAVSIGAIVLLKKRGAKE